MTPMGPLKFVGRLVLFLFLLTIVGQLRWSGKSLETYYHQGVNSPAFQNGWIAATAPFRWVGGRFGLSEETSRPETAR